jgi:hypothetical protein
MAESHPTNFLSIRKRPWQERFWLRVRKTDGCWLWTGSAHVRGYGSMKIDYRTVRAHRLSYEMANGPIPAGAVVCHRCDTPACVRPDHLFIGGQSENMLDASAKGRLLGARVPVTHCPQGHPYSGDNVGYYRGAKAGRHFPAKYCRTCAREKAARRRTA